MSEKMESKEEPQKIGLEKMGTASQLDSWLVGMFCKLDTNSLWRFLGTLKLDTVLDVLN